MSNNSTPVDDAGELDVEKLVTTHGQTVDRWLKKNRTIGEAYDEANREARATIQTHTTSQIEKAVAAASFPFGPTYSFLYSYHKDVLEELEEHLATLKPSEEQS